MIMTKTKSTKQSAEKTVRDIRSVRRQNLLDRINPYLRESFVHQMV